MLCSIRSRTNYRLSPFFWRRRNGFSNVANGFFIRGARENSLEISRHPALYSCSLEIHGRTPNLGMTFAFEEGGINYETEAGPEDLREAQCHSVGHPQHRAVAKGGHRHNPASLQRPGVHWDEEGNQIEPHSQEPNRGRHTQRCGLPQQVEEEPGLADANRIAHQVPGNCPPQIDG